MSRTSSWSARTPLRLAAVAVLAVGSISLAGCSSISSLFGGAGDPTRDETGTIVEAGEASVFTLAVGDCFDDTAFTSENVSSVPTVPCADAHDNEVYYDFRLDGDAYPGKDEVIALADEGCMAQFDSFVGLAYSESVLDFFPLYPTEEGWNELNDRVVTCAVYEPSMKVTGSLAGAAR